MDTLFSNVTIVTMDEAMHVYFDAYLGVTDGKISYLAREAPKEKTKRLVPGEGMVLMPGLINCHTHLPMSVLRGYADDVELSSWLNDYIFPHEDRLDGRSAKAAALLSIAECVRFGTTSISDMYNFCDEIAEAVAESGIKANIARGATLFGEDFDFETHPACRELVALKEKWDGYDNGRIRVEASVHGEYTSDYRLWDALSEFAINEKAGMHVHLSETKAEHEQCLERNGLTPAQVLDCHHVFDTRAIAAHCVWVTPEDMRLLAKRGVTAVHCPVSNLKLASGCAPVTEMVKAGMNVAAAEAYIDRLAAENQTTPPHRRSAYIIKDVRLFLNSVERGIRLMQGAGVGAQVARQDTDSEICLTVRIPKTRRPAAG